MDEAFGHWFAGFFAGEGCFHIRKQAGGRFALAASIELRRDDQRILQDVQLATGLGSITALNPRGKNFLAKPQVRWLVSSRPDCRGLADIFMRYPLRARKGRDFHVWVQALEAWEAMPSRGGAVATRTPFDYNEMARLYDELRELRQYRAETAT